MKESGELTCLVRDYGTFLSLALKLAETYKKVYYSTPCDSEYKDIGECMIGYGFPQIERVDDPLDPEFMRKIDFAVFPDIGFVGEQHNYREHGIPVWGSNGADELELYRTRFLTWIKELGLPVAPYVVKRGITALREQLKGVKNVWIKVNRFRSQMETWHHYNYESSEQYLDRLAVIFGTMKEQVVFVVQDDIPNALEGGCDWIFSGEYATEFFQGYEKKNELYLAARTKYRDLPEPVRVVNDAIAPTLRDKYLYQNFVASEIRVVDKTPFFIDPTLRLPGQSGEHLLESVSNLADGMWQWANGNHIDFTFACEFAAEATLHLCNFSDEQSFKLNIPEKVRRWFKPYHAAMVDGVYCYPHRDCDEPGVLLGIGDTVEACIDHLEENYALLKDLPVKADLSGFADLLAEVRKGQKAGMPFTDKPVPKPSSILNKED